MRAAAHVEKTRQDGESPCAGLRVLPVITARRGSVRSQLPGAIDGARSGLGDQPLL